MFSRWQFITEKEDFSCQILREEIYSANGIFLYGLAVIFVFEV